jgi:hypothetical protein
VARPETGGRLALRIKEPMLSLVKSHDVLTCTLDRSSSSALPELTMVLVKKAGHTASPPQATLSRPAAALEPSAATSVPVRASAPDSAPGPTPAAAHEPAVSAPAPANAPGTITAGASPADADASPQLEQGVSPRHAPDEDLLQMGSDGDGQPAAPVGDVDLLGELDGDGTAGCLRFTEGQMANLFGDQHVELPVPLLLHCSIEGIMQPNEQRVSMSVLGALASRLACCSLPTHDVCPSSSLPFICRRS